MTASSKLQYSTGWACHRCQYTEVTTATDVDHAIACTSVNGKAVVHKLFAKFGAGALEHLPLPTKRDGGFCIGPLSTGTISKALAETISDVDRAKVNAVAIVVTWQLLQPSRDELLQDELLVQGTLCTHA
jgi:hypothetical protein